MVAMSVGVEDVDRALAGLRDGFQADGADLEVLSVSDGVARVRLIVTEATCLECIVPGHILREVVAASVSQACPELRRVEVEDPR